MNALTKSRPAKNYMAVPEVSDFLNLAQQMMIGYTPEWSDRLFASVANIDVTYPPYDLVKVTDNHYRIVIAVAGFTRDELEIEVEKQKLTVSGKKTEETTKETAKNWLHRGIATRAFSRTYILGDYTRISEAKFDNGLLTIEAIQEIPENLAAKKIEIQ